MSYFATVFVQQMAEEGLRVRAVSQVPSAELALSVHFVGDLFDELVEVDAGLDADAARAEIVDQWMIYEAEVVAAEILGCASRVQHDVVKIDTVDCAPRAGRRGHVPVNVVLAFALGHVRRRDFRVARGGDELDRVAVRVKSEPAVRAVDCRVHHTLAVVLKGRVGVSPGQAAPIRSVFVFRSRIKKDVFDLLQTWSSAVRAPVDVLRPAEMRLRSHGVHQQVDAAILQRLPATMRKTG